MIFAPKNGLLMSKMKKLELFDEKKYFLEKFLKKRSSFGMIGKNFWKSCEFLRKNIKIYKIANENEKNYKS